MAVGRQIWGKPAVDVLNVILPDVDVLSSGLAEVDSWIGRGYGGRRFLEIPALHQRPAEVVDVRPEGLVIVLVSSPGDVDADAEVGEDFPLQAEDALVSFIRAPL